MRRALSALLGMFVILLGVACGQQATPAPASPAPTKAPVSSTTQKPAWQQEWEALLSSARQEGKVVVLTGVGPEVRDALTEAFKKATGIDVEFVTGRAAEQMQKLSTERRAGLYLSDLFIGGATTPVNQLKPAGFIDPIEPLLLLPEVKDLTLWRDQKLAYVDKDKALLAFASKVQATCIIMNTDLVKAGEVKGYRDLLDPKWKGKIAIYDPVVAGIGLRWFGITSTRILDLDYMRQLAKLEPVIVRDARQQVEWIAKAKYPLGVAAEPPIVYEFQQAGAPLKGVLPVEGLWVASGWGNVAVINKPAHPAATRVFLNWLLTKEAQTAYSRASGDPSNRVDVPTDHIDPLYIPQKGQKYILSEEEEILLGQPEAAKIAQQVFAELLK